MCCFFKFILMFYFYLFCNRWLFLLLDFFYISCLVLVKCMWLILNTLLYWRSAARRELITASQFYTEVKLLSLLLLFIYHNFLKISGCLPMKTSAKTLFSSLSAPLSKHCALSGATYYRAWCLTEPKNGNSSNIIIPRLGIGPTIIYLYINT